MSLATRFVHAYNHAHRDDRLTVIERSGGTVAPDSEGDCTVLEFADGSRAFASDYADVLADVERSQTQQLKRAA